MLKSGFDQLLETAIIRYGSTAGMLGDAADYHLSRSGKRNRGRLLHAVAGKDLAPRQYVACAGACELVHEASIVHDDLQDVESERRGQPPVWRKFGEDAALLLGDHLIASAFRAVASAPLDPSSCNRMTIQLATAVSRAASGQHLQLMLAPGGSGLQEVYEMVARGKTGAFLALPLQYAGELRRVSPPAAAALETCGEALGLAYQIVDDMSSMRDYSPNSDLRNGVVTAAVVMARAVAPKEDPFKLLAENEGAADEVHGRCEAWLSEVVAKARAETAVLPLDMREAIHTFVATGIETPLQQLHRSAPDLQVASVRSAAVR